jgi:hypothetical protein
MLSFEENFPVPTRSREENVRSAMLSGLGLWFWLDKA